MEKSFSRGRFRASKRRFWCWRPTWWQMTRFMSLLFQFEVWANLLQAREATAMPASRSCSESVCIWRPSVVLPPSHSLFAEESVSMTAEWRRSFGSFTILLWERMAAVAPEPIVRFAK